ncbi:MAG: hypothetical protein R3C68_14515 [Myxococcota bacterium]
MPTINEDITLKYQTTKDGDMEETSFSSGDEVEIIQTWSEAPFCLIKDADGHFYNIPKDKVDS